MSYTFTPEGSIYGTYKVIATYKSYNDIQSDPAIVTYEKKKEKEKEPEPEPPTEPITTPEDPPEENQQQTQNTNNP